MRSSHIRVNTVCLSAVTCMRKGKVNNFVCRLGAGLCTNRFFTASDFVCLKAKKETKHVNNKLVNQHVFTLFSCNVKKCTLAESGTSFFFYFVVIKKIQRWQKPREKKLFIKVQASKYMEFGSTMWRIVKQLYCISDVTKVPFARHRSFV